MTRASVWALIQGLATLAYRRTEELPLNIQFLIEGEEEIGCPNLLGFVREHAKELACDFLALSDTEIPAVDRPALTYATRGGLGLALTVTGPVRDLHSGFFGGLVRNPAEALAGLLARLHHPETRAIDIPGFYDDVAEPEDWEREILAHPPVDPAALLAESGSPGLWGEAGRSVLERIWFRPTAEITSLSGGYLGAGRKVDRAGEGSGQSPFPADPEPNRRGRESLYRAVWCANTLRRESVWNSNFGPRENRS